MKGNPFSKEDIAKSLQEIIVNVLYDKILMAVKEKDVKTILVAGGVSANRRLREKFLEFTNIKTENKICRKYLKSDNKSTIEELYAYDSDNDKIKIEKIPINKLLDPFKNLLIKKNKSNIPTIPYIVLIK